MKKVKLLLPLFILGALYTGCVREDAGPGCPDASCCKTEGNEFVYEYRLSINDLPAKIKIEGFRFHDKINDRTHTVNICPVDYHVILDTLRASYNVSVFDEVDSLYISGDRYELVTDSPPYSGPAYYINVVKLVNSSGELVFANN